MRHQVALEVGGRRLSLETGRIAKQADGAVVVSYNDTTVLVTAVSAHSMREGQEFFPLTVEYQEKLELFLFWYEKYGITNNDFYEMFYKYDEILSYYEQSEI